ncbi:MAG: YwaF family protein [Clostridia bacterium]|nr:YwaF family protein [Clostridia bacterium]
MADFFGFGGYQREVEGYFSWQHLLFVSILMLIMVALAVFFGLRNKRKDEKTKNKVLVWSAILIDGIYLFELIFFAIRSKDPLNFLYILPLFLCSIQMLTIPLAAFSKGRIKNAALDFVFIFGLLGAVLGTYFAGNNYGSYPVLCIDNLISGLTHSISGFAALYIVISGMESMEKKNIVICFAILSVFCVLAMIANALIPYNYMFLVRADGTPYELVYALVSGNAVLYPMLVILLFFLYIILFYVVYYLIKNKLAKKNNA